MRSLDNLPNRHLSAAETQLATWSWSNNPENFPRILQVLTTLDLQINFNCVTNSTCCGPACSTCRQPAQLVLSWWRELNSVRMMNGQRTGCQKLDSDSVHVKIILAKKEKSCTNRVSVGFIHFTTTIFCTGSPYRKCSPLSNAMM